MDGSESAAQDNGRRVLFSEVHARRRRGFAGRPALFACNLLS